MRTVPRAAQRTLGHTMILSMNDCLACMTWPRTLTIMTYLPLPSPPPPPPPPPPSFLPSALSLSFCLSRSLIFLNVCRRYASTRQACFSDILSFLHSSRYSKTVIRKIVSRLLSALPGCINFSAASFVVSKMRCRRYVA